MQPVTLTTADQLKPGDSFYKQADETKTVYTVQDYGKMRKDKIFATKPGLTWPDPIPQKTEVIFLQHNTVLLKT